MTATETKVHVKKESVEYKHRHDGTILYAIVPGIKFVYTGKVPFGISPHTRYELGFSPEGTEARKTHGGPLHSELFGWLGALPTVIAAHHIPDESITIEVAEGTLIEVEGHGTFRVLAPPTHTWLGYYPTVEVV